MLLTTVRNRLSEDSKDSESDDSDEEYVTNDRQIARSERQHEVSFLGRKKGCDMRA